MDFLTKVYLTYMFIALYFMFMFILIFIQNRKDLYKVPPITKRYTVSIVIPCYNEEVSIGRTIQNLIDNGYDNLKKIIVADDCSTDNSYKIAKSYAKKYPGLVKVVKTLKNTGNAAGAKNCGAKYVKTDLIGFVDADSFPVKGAIENMIGFFDDPKTGAVTSTVLVHNRKNILEQLQAIEYLVIKFTRKLFEYIDAIYVTPGPLAMYRTKDFNTICGFDEDNLTEDIEIAWKMQYHGFKIKMCVPALVYSIAPSKVKPWFKQRIRWNMGGFQTMVKYKKIFFRRGMLGKFILPFFASAWLLGLFGMGILVYRYGRLLILKYLFTSYSVKAHTAILSLNDLSLVGDVMVFLGSLILVLGLTITFMAIFSIKEPGQKRYSLWSIAVYKVFYLSLYPILMVTSIYKLIRGHKTW